MASARRPPADDRKEPLDAVVVGAGIIGLACAWQAARNGLRVRVLERDRPGAGASGVAAGILAAGYEPAWDNVGFQRLAAAGHRRWERFAGELAHVTGAGTGYLHLGAVHVAVEPDEVDWLRRRQELIEYLGYEATWLSATAARRLEPGLVERFSSAIHAPAEAAADPRLLVKALTAAARAAGAELVTGSGGDVVDALTERERLIGVRTRDGAEHRARWTVLATGAWSGSADWLPAAARPPVRPVKGQLLIFRADRGSRGHPGPRGSRARPRPIVCTERMYMVPRGGDRLVLGATVEERGFDLEVSEEALAELQRDGSAALPELASAERIEPNVGLRPGTPDDTPVVGPSALDGLIVASGHYRDGILLAPITAEGVVALLTGAKPPAELAVADPRRFG